MFLLVMELAIVRHLVLAIRHHKWQPTDVSVAKLRDISQRHYLHLRRVAMEMSDELLPSK